MAGASSQHPIGEGGWEDQWCTAHRDLEDMSGCLWQSNSKELWPEIIIMVPILKGLLHTLNIKDQWKPAHRDLEDMSGCLWQSN